MNSFQLSFLQQALLVQPPNPPTPTPATTTTCIPLVYLNITYRFGEEFLYTLVVPTPSTYTSSSKSFLWWVHPSGQDSEIDQI